MTAGKVRVMDKAAEVDLILKATDGDQAAASALIEEHQRSLYAFILRLSGSPEMAEDIVQDAFVRALANLHRFDPRFRFSTWIFTIAKRLYMNAMQKHRPVYDSDTVSGKATDAGRPFESPIKFEQSRVRTDSLNQALASLPEEQREIVVLFHQLEWPILRIAEFVGMPEGTVKSHLHRGRKKLRKYLEANHANVARDFSFAHTAN